MNEPIAILARTVALQAAMELELHVGDLVVARVARVPDAHGRGVLSLAGALRPAQLPPDVQEGDKLQLRVEGAKDGAVVFRAVSPAPAEAASSAHAAAAAGIAAVPLPDGRVAHVRVEDDEEQARRGGTGTSSAVIRVGGLELRLELDPGGIRASVLADPTAAAGAEAAVPALADELARATGRPSTVALARRALNVHA